MKKYYLMFLFVVAMIMLILYWQLGISLIGFLSYVLLSLVATLSLFSMLHSTKNEEQNNTQKIDSEL